MYVYSDYCIRNSCKFKFKDTFCALTIKKYFCSDNLLCVCLLGFYLGNCRRRWTEGIKSFEGCLRHHIWILLRIAAEIPSGGKKALSIHYTVPSYLYIVKRYYIKWDGTVQCIEVRLSRFLSGWFITMAGIHPPERKLAKRTFVQCIYTGVHEKISTACHGLLKSAFW